MDELWKTGWAVQQGTLARLRDDDLKRIVKIRQQPLTVHAALTRAVAHQAYHVGQIVLIARMTAEHEWTSLSIPKGKSQQYNAAPDREKKPG
jgi:hypothetical protein